MVKAHYRRGYIRADGTKISPSNVSTHCRKRSKTYDYFVGRIGKGAPSFWPHKAEEAKAFTEEEILRIAEALEGVSDFLLSSNLKSFYRMAKSRDFPNPATSGGQVIVLYDTAFGKDRNLQRILSHELGHQNYSELMESERQDYRRVTGWRLEMEPDLNIYYKGREGQYVEEDGKISHEEDYANNLEYFLYDPDKLKKVTPQAYEWLKRKFGEKVKLKGKRK